MTDNRRDARIATLKRCAEQRRIDARERTEKAARRLLETKGRFTLAGLAREAGVSLSYLYKYPDLKLALQQLRERHTERCSKPPPPIPSEKSKDRVIAKLRRHLKELADECAVQRRQMEALSGQLYELTTERFTPAPKAQRHTPRCRPAPLSNLPPKVRARLRDLGIRLTDSIRAKLAAFPAQRITQAVEVTEEAALAGRLRSRSRFFIRALENGWEPSDDATARRSQANGFKDWFNLAREKGLVTASQGTERGILVLTRDKRWLPYDALSQKPGWRSEDLGASA